jgi:hypothetical protein
LIKDRIRKPDIIVFGVIEKFVQGVDNGRLVDDGMLVAHYSFSVLISQFQFNSEGVWWITFGVLLL